MTAQSMVRFVFAFWLPPPPLSPLPPPPPPSFLLLLLLSLVEDDYWSQESFSNEHSGKREHVKCICWEEIGILGDSTHFCT